MSIKRQIVSASLKTILATCRRYRRLPPESAGIFPGLVRVRVVAVDSVVILDVLERGIHQTSGTTVVSVRSGAVQQILDADLDEFARLSEVLAFQRARLHHGKLQFAKQQPNKNTGNLPPRMPNIRRTSAGSSLAKPPPPASSPRSRGTARWRWG